MDFHNIVAFGIIVAVCICFAHGDLSPQKRQILEEPCPERWTRFNKYCYKVGDKKTSWELAQTACNSSGGGGSLAEITSAKVNEFLVKLIQESTVDEAWIGLKRDGDAFLWNPSKHLASYVNWAIGEPNKQTSLDSCVLMNIEGKWKEHSCKADYFNYICEQLPKEVPY